MLDLWRPPGAAGEPTGCLATTYTFAPGLFDEQCLARFLEIESEPNREDLAFLLERESRLGGVYAGILVDHTQAGVGHSLRWDVLPVRIRAGKQHAKVSLLAWTSHVRIIVASANMTDPGYRTNFEVAAAIDLTPSSAELNMLGDAVAFLRELISLVPGSADRPPEVRRAHGFLDQVEQQTHHWAPAKRGRVRRQLTFTLPTTPTMKEGRSSLEEAVTACRKRGGSPDEAWVASPFFDIDDTRSRVVASLCKLMARATTRHLCFCVPAVRDDQASPVPRLAAPESLIRTPGEYSGIATVEMLPGVDNDKNRRPWHAKMLALRSSAYSALMIGSSNFTCAGLGVGGYRNAEANLLTVVDREAYAREVGHLEGIWPEMEEVDDPDSAEWLGAQPERVEEEQAATPPVPAGFLSATYRAGDHRHIVLRLDPPHLPSEWRVHACGTNECELLASSSWDKAGRPKVIEVPWSPPLPPDRLLVRWEGQEAFLPINVEDGRKLPPPAQLETMSADDMLWILAATDPSAAFRAWAKRQHSSDIFDTDLDSATPVDLDPLRRYDLEATFLHRIRRRARVLAQLRSNLQRPVWGRQALEWRLQGLIGIAPLADRLVREITQADGAADEALFTLADFLIVLREVDYQPRDGALPRSEFNKIFKPFLSELAEKLSREVAASSNRLSDDAAQFWNRVVEQCRT